MERGDGGNPAASSFEVVKDFLAGLGGRKPTREEAMTIAPQLEDLYAKIVRLRALSPTFTRVNLSDEVWNLMALIGKESFKNRPPGGLRSAASFL